jgi:purine-binding chemotaxis protein CheW
MLPSALYKIQNNLVMMISRIKGGYGIMADLMNVMGVNAMADCEGKYLTFSLAAEEYGIGIRKVKEIIGMMAITRIPQTPSYVKGVINLRGKVIPVVALRLKFGLEEIDYTNRTCIIVVEVEADAGNVMLGIIVDSVSEVMNVKGADIDPAPTLGMSLKTDYILGMAKVGNGVKILLDIDQVISDQELEVIRQAA